MVSTHVKGLKYENEYKAILKAKGWTVDDKHGMGWWCHNKDFWGKFDLLGFNASGWIAVQVKSKDCATLKIAEDLQKFSLQMPPNTIVQLAIRMNNNIFRVLTLKNDGGYFDEKISVASKPK